MIVLLTGANGFLGGCIIDTLGNSNIIKLLGRKNADNIVILKITNL